jgi:hypothetical protein
VVVSWQDERESASMLEDRMKQVMAQSMQQQQELERAKQSKVSQATTPPSLGNVSLSAASRHGGHAHHLLPHRSVLHDGLVLKPFLPTCF